MLEEAYGELAPSKTTCEDWFKRFKSGDFNVQDKERPGQPTKFEDAELQAILDENATLSENKMAEMLNVNQTTISRRLYALGKIRKEGKWVPHK